MDFSVYIKSRLLYTRSGLISYEVKFRQNGFTSSASFTSKLSLHFSHPLCYTVGLQNTVFFATCHAPSCTFFPKWMKFVSIRMSLVLNESAQSIDENIFLLSGLAWEFTRWSTAWRFSLLSARFESPQTFAPKFDLTWGQIVIRQYWAIEMSLDSRLDY